MLVRRVKTVRGTVTFDIKFAPRFEYARVEHSVERRDGALVFASRGADGATIRLRSEIPLDVDDGGAARARFTLRAGDTSGVRHGRGPGRHGEPIGGGGDYVAQAFKDTVNFWRAWIGRAQYTGRWRETVCDRRWRGSLQRVVDHAKRVGVARDP